MAYCLCCNREGANIKIRTDVQFHICGKSDCISPKGQNITEWFLEGSDNPKNLNANYNVFVKEVPYIEVIIESKSYKIPNDKRVLKGLRSKLQELVLKHRGIETDHTD